MAKIAFIGAGSYEFTRGLVKDILTFPALRGSTLALMDINDERLDFARRSVGRIIREGNYPATILATKDRKEALKGADAVLCTILAAPVSIWRHDIEIPKRFGVDTNIGDTRGPSGIFRALRTIPVMLDICRDMERLCPNAILLNYTNPMAMLCRAMQRTSPLRITGLCHSVQGTAMMLAHWIGAPMDEITYTCAGINHQAWYIRYDWNRKDAIPLIRKAIEGSRKIYNEEQVRNEMFLNLGYYVTESSGHNSEYSWWFRKRPDLIRKYCTTGTGWNPGAYGYIVKDYLRREKTWHREAENWIANPAPLNLKRGHEYAASIINAYLGGGPFLFNGNVPNTGLVTNLPHGRVRRGARLRGPERVQSRPRRRSAAATGRAQQRQHRGRGDGRRGGAHRQPRNGLPRHRLRPAHRRRPVPGGDPEDGGRHVQEEQSVPAAVQTLKTRPVSEQDHDAPAGILIIRLGSLGDVANTLPAVQALKESLPGERFGWLVEEPSAELVRLAGVAERIILFPRRRLSELLRRPWRWPALWAEILRLRREIRAQGYLCALDFQGNLKSGFLGMLSGARDRIGFARGHCREMNWLFNNILALPSSARLLRAEKAAALAQAVEPGAEAAAGQARRRGAERRARRAVPADVPGRWAAGGIASGHERVRPVQALARRAFRRDGRAPPARRRRALRGDVRARRGGTRLGSRRAPRPARRACRRSSRWASSSSSCGARRS